jgi:GTP-binding protein HflX
VAAFRATLEEIESADAVIHVIDITHQNAAEQVQVVDDLLAELNLKDKPRILALNKIDLLVDHQQDEEYSQSLKATLNQNEDSIVTVSAAKGWGLNNLLKSITTLLDTEKGQLQDAPGFWVDGSLSNNFNN